MTRGFWDTVNWIINQADILVIVLDARFVDDTMNAELLSKIKRERKPYLFAVTKADLAKKVDKSVLPRPFVVISTRQRRGKSALRERILAMAGQHYGKDSDVRVGVLGYPNVGKSSVINMLKGARSAPTGGLPGKTRGEQFVRTHRRILMIDAPGVIPYHEKDIVKHAVTGVLDPSRLKDPVMVLKGIMEKYPGTLERHFGIEASETGQEAAEKIAVKKNLVMRGGVPDAERAARMVIAAIQKGKIRL